MLKNIAGYFSEFGRQIFLKALLKIPLINLRSKFNSTLIRERSHMTSAAEGGGGFEMLTVADKGGRGSKPC